jgi:hypothetical protein
VAVLAHGTATPYASGTVVEALDASGKVLASHDVNQQGPQTVIACAVAGAGGSSVSVHGPVQTTVTTPR